jgi:general secretion pathway protein A
MFTTHFKMTRHPFCERTSAEFLMRDERVAQGLARLKYLLQQGTIGLLTGTTGVGKSSLIKLFLHDLGGKNQLNPVYLHLTRLSSTGFLKLLVSALGEVPRHGKDRLFLQILEKARAVEPVTFLIVDEAQFLEPDALSDLRLLVSSALEDRPPLKILLSGQEGLRDNLKRASHADAAHRISVHYHIPAMDKDQTLAYIDFQVQQSGGPAKLFDPEVKSVIYDHTRGIPRQINNLATACLIHASGKNAPSISPQILQGALAEFQIS